MAESFCWLTACYTWSSFLLVLKHFASPTTCWSLNILKSCTGTWSHAAQRQGLLSCTSSSEIWSCSLLHTSSSLKGFPITQNSLAWSTLAPWLIKSLWNRLRYNTSMLLRARGRSGGRLVWVITFGLPWKAAEGAENKQRAVMDGGWLYWYKRQQQSQIHAWDWAKLLLNSTSPLAPKDQTLPIYRGREHLEYHTRKSHRARCLLAAPACPQEKSPARVVAPHIFVIPAATLPSALLSSSAGGSNWERNLLWQMCGRFPPWLIGIRDKPLTQQLCWKLFLPANPQDLGLSHVHLQKSLVSHK